MLKDQLQAVSAVLQDRLRPTMVQLGSARLARSDSGAGAARAPAAVRTARIVVLKCILIGCVQIEGDVLVVMFEWFLDGLLQNGLSLRATANPLIYSSRLISPREPRNKNMKLQYNDNSIADLRQLSTNVTGFRISRHNRFEL